jgi:MFS family permease
VSRDARASLALATFLTLLPVTLPVPGLAELVIGGRGGTRFDAHLFMALNMASGVLAIPVVLRLARGGRYLKRWVAGLLAADAVAFLLMALSRSPGELLAARLVDGAFHLPAITLLMIWANRAAGERRGAVLGLIASATMAGIAVGAPLGGWLVTIGGANTVLRVAVGLLLLAAAACARAAPPPVSVAPANPRCYRWDHRVKEAWAPLALGFMERFTIGVFVSTFTLYLAEVRGVGPGTRGLLMSLFLVPFAVLCYPAGAVTDRVGWFRPLVAAHLGFGLVYAAYGVVPVPALAAIMVVSGILSAFMYTPTLVVVGDLARQGAGEGLFGALQVAGSVGFLAGPVVGGVLVELARSGHQQPAYPVIFAAVGALQIAVAAGAAFALYPRAHRHAAASPTRLMSQLHGGGA